MIIDLVRERRAIKRGGAYEITQLPEDVAPDDGDPQLARMSDALDELAGREPALAELVDLKYFCGFTFEEIAQQRQVSVRTVQRDWRKVRLILFSELAAR